MDKLERLQIQAYNNNDKKFTVIPESGCAVLGLVNTHYQDPKREGIPFICQKGSCRSCVIKIEGNEELLEPPTKAEQMSLSVGKTTIKSGYRLACLAKFK
ncbi:2Fe-2S iron-sulfur cluster-binding protein [Halalkalibacter kiskunsagensis]|uniref:2Fe-2S iron-sulfur cluster-binding protein n=1 Tax=Halalkalibacter kiskunsagensis TaxID=1548599 RepID=A0ABV6KBW7_9BACI